MIAERPPIFTPNSRGFQALYNLVFSVDLNHLIYLGGAIQGSGVAAKTLSVDNSANSTACSVNVGGAVRLVPPFAISYIPCENALEVVVSGGATTSAIELKVLTYSEQEQTIVKKSATVGGLPPVVVTGGEIVYWSGTKIISIGAPITSYLNLTNDSSSTSVLRWGFDVGLAGGVISIGSTQTINFDASLREMWVGSITPNTCQTYWNGG